MHHRPTDARELPQLVAGHTGSLPPGAPSVHCADAQETHLFHVAPAKEPHEPDEVDGMVADLRRQLHQRARTVGQVFFASGPERYRDDITFKGIRSALAMMGVRPMPSDAVLHRMFNRIDSNHDKHVSYDEFKAALGWDKRWI